MTNKTNDKVSGHIYNTADLTKFKIYEFNREVKLRSELVSVLEERGRFDVPILVTDDYYVIDGQHRLQAAKHVGCSIDYIFQANNALGRVAEINSKQKSWTRNDFITHFAKQGNDQYLKLQELLSSNLTSKLSDTSVINIALYRNAMGGVNPIIKSGKFEFYDYDNAKKICGIINDFAIKSGVKNQLRQNVTLAIFRITKYKKFKKERLDELAETPSVIRNLNHVSAIRHETEKELLEHYNYNRKSESIRFNYHINEKGKVIIEEELIEL